MKHETSGSSDRGAPLLLRRLVAATSADALVEGWLVDPTIASTIFDVLAPLRAASELRFPDDQSNGQRFDVRLTSPKAAPGWWSCGNPP